MRIGSLFSGIGGLELGLERAGLGHVEWQVEIDEFCRAVLARHWPSVRRFSDVRECNATNLVPVDLLCGGFPCQDVSSAGKGAGLAGARSGLWYEYLRLVEELRPAIVVVENVASGKKRWLAPVREGLEALGYFTVALELGACDVGAPHRRLRVFVVAYADRKGQPALAEHGEVGGARAAARAATDAERGEVRKQQRRGGRSRGQSSAESRHDGGAGALADADREHGGSRRARRAATRDPIGRHDESPRATSDADGARLPRPVVEEDAARLGRVAERAWADDAMPEPALRRMDDGLPARLVRSRQRRRNQRLKALGNAVVPQQAEAVGRYIMGSL